MRSAFTPGPGPKQMTWWPGGATWAGSVKDLSAESDVIISIVGYPRDVAQIYLDSDGVLENAAPGTLAIDMTTSEPTLAKTLYKTRN